jgi:hypothetical protein
MAQYYTDFSGDALGVAPAGWTQRWVTTGSPTYTVVAGGDYVGGQATRFIATTAAHRLFSNDAVDADVDRANAEVLTRQRISDTTGARGGACVRAVGTATTGTQSAYRAWIADGNVLTLNSLLLGTSTELGAFTLERNVTEDTNFFWMRLRADGTTISVKAWASGETEPVAWQISVTNASVAAAGWCGVFNSEAGTGDTVDIDVVSIATNGETAAFAGIIPAAAEEEASQVAVMATTEAEPDVQVSQSAVLALGIYPAEFIQSSQAALSAVTDSVLDIEASQLSILVLAAGRTADPKVCAWTFTQDGHDYYVLRLGTVETLVYDTHAQQWYNWGSGSAGLWRAFTGTNWLGGTGLGGPWSNVVVGDDGNGALYFLDPNGTYDDSALTGSEDPQPFTRIAQGQIALRGYASVPCYGVELLGSVGDLPEDTTLTAVTLYTSDDRGHTYDDCGTVTVEPGAYDTRVQWQSLGSMTTPGRLFKVVDDGALKRIDGFEMAAR